MSVLLRKSKLPVFLFICSLSLYRCSSSPVAPASTGIIQGRVLNAANLSNPTPIAGASVWTAPVTRAVITDSLGRYTIDSFPAGQYTVAASQTGYVLGIDSITVSANTITTQDIYLEPGVIAIPAAPLIDTVAAGDSSVTVRWYPANGATSYKLYYKQGTTIDSVSGTPDTVVTGTAVTIRSLINDTMYAFAVIAVNTAGASPLSAVRTAKPGMGLAAPSVPVISIAAPGDGSVKVTWNSVTGATSYNLYYDTGAIVSKAGGTVAAGIASPILITGLTNQTQYAFAVSAVNSGGESGLSAVLTATPSAASAAATVTDTDGNVYHLDTIGAQVWMVENLRTTRFNDGTPIPLVTENVAWTALTTPGYCWNNNDSVANKGTYGALYNWYAVNTGKLAPKGWHVASDSEWGVLVITLGGDDSAAGKLKEAGTVHWLFPNTGATNITGFSALPGGFRYDYGAFAAMGVSGCWWSSTAFVATDSWCRSMDYSTAAVARADDYRTFGLSVRCVRD